MLVVGCLACFHLLDVFFSFYMHLRSDAAQICGWNMMHKRLFRLRWFFLIVCFLRLCCASTMRKHAWMSDLLRSTWQAAVLGLVMVLGCLIFSASCCRLISPASCYAAWSSLNHVKLLDLVFIMPRCLIVSIPHATLLNLPHRMSVCYVSWCSLSHVMLFDLVIKKVRSLIFGTSCYVLGLPLLWCLCSLYIVEFFVWSSCCYAAWPSLPLVRLLGLPYLMWCCLMCSVSYCAIRSCPHDATLHDSLRQTTLLDLP